MKDEPGIVKELRAAEKLGILQSKVQSAYEKLEPVEESSDDVPDETVSFAEDDDAEKKETVCNGAAYEQTVKELPDSEIYRTIFENVSDEIIYVNKYGKIVNVNRRSYDIFGYKPEEMIGKNFSRLGWLGVRDLPKMLKLFKGALGGKTIDLLELEVKHRDGHIIPVEVSTRPVKKNGKTVGFLSIVRDITERKKAEEEINYLKEYNENILESNPNSIIVIKGDQIEYVNKSFVSTFGKTKNDYISKKLKEVIPAFEKLLPDQNKMKELEVKGKSFSVSSFVVKKAEEEEEEERIGIILQDITERKKAEEALKESEEKYRALFEASADGILMVDVETKKFGYANPALCKMLGYSEKELTEMGINDIHPKDSLKQVISEFEAQAKGEKTLAEDIPCLRKDGTKLYVDINTATILLGGKKYNVGFFRDITKQRNAEEETKLAHEELNQIFNTAADGMRVIDKDFNMLRINETLSNLTGINKDEAIGKKCYEIFFSPLCRTHDCPLTRILKGDKHVGCEIEKERKDGTKISCILTATPFKGIDGELLGIVEDFKDITQWKKAEEKFKILFNSSRDAIMTLDPPSWKFTSANPSTVELFKAKEESEFTEKGPWDASPEFQPDGTSSSDKAKKMIEKAMNEGSSFFEWTHKTLDGKVFPATVLLTRVEIEKGKPFLQATVRDITEQKKSEGEIKKKIEELERFENVTVDRELMMVELKKEINELCKKLGEKPRYDIDKGGAKK